ncbi:hypothetical protein MSG34_19430 [Vibrio sp. 1CM2L]|uniref:hypothetical protein n=1 Tax=Vibrio sp. 1CM2L TaxID=2929166 RepID=UPI0020BE61D2|nr:hypothetical protein [Vibrio sp. 1CM2L]MCK8078335.1 hypothetical protein [Vibrio sp. 1CM2L]
MNKRGNKWTPDHVTERILARNAAEQWLELAPISDDPSVSRLEMGAKWMLGEFLAGRDPRKGLPITTGERIKTGSTEVFRDNEDPRPDPRDKFFELLHTLCVHEGVAEGARAFLDDNPSMIEVGSFKSLADAKSDKIYERILNNVGHHLGVRTSKDKTANKFNRVRSAYVDDDSLWLPRVRAFDKFRAEQSRLLDEIAASNDIKEKERLRNQIEEARKELKEVIAQEDLTRAELRTRSWYKGSLQGAVGGA